MQPTTWSARVASEIRAELGRRRISTTAFGASLGISKATTNRWLSGEKALDLENLTLLASGLGVSVVDLVSWGEVDPVDDALRARQGSNLRPSDYGLLPVGVPLLEQHTLALAV